MTEVIKAKQRQELKDRIMQIRQDKRWLVGQIALPNPEPTIEERYAMVAKGEAKLLPLSELRRGYRNEFWHYYDFPVNKEREKAATDAKKLVAELNTRLNTFFDRLMDQVVYGKISSEDALRIIEKAEEYDAVPEAKAAKKSKVKNAKTKH